MIAVRVYMQLFSNYFHQYYYKDKSMSYNRYNYYFHLFVLCFSKWSNCRFCQLATSDYETCAGMLLIIPHACPFQLTPGLSRYCSIHRYERVQFCISI